MSKKKIALVGFRLSGGGGDKVMANLSTFFYKKGFDVHIIIFHNELGYSYSGTVFNLGKLKSENNWISNKVKRFYHLNKYIKKEKFDFIIDFRFRINFVQELLISKYIYSGTKVFYTIHSSELNNYMPDNTFLTKLIYGSKHKIVAICDEMCKLIKAKHDLKNLATIYNPIDLSQINEKSNKPISLNFDYIITAGSFSNNIKQFDKLIVAYSKSELPNKNIKLLILGDGILKSHLINIAKDNGVMNKVVFLGFKSNPYKYFSKSKYFILTSKFEGLPMVLLESLASGSPVISFSCPTGPSEIINHGVNGMLIENQNFEKLIIGMNKMIKDDGFYNVCKNNATSSVNKFSVDKIGDQWLRLINIHEESE